MSEIETRLDEILAHPLSAASGGGALGYVGLDIPPDLLCGSGRVACHLPWTTQSSAAKASRWLESGFPGWAHSMVEDWAEGKLDCFEHVVFSRGEDVSQRLYYYICELQRRGRLRGPQPLVFDIARIPRDTSRHYTATSLRKLLQQLGISAEALSGGIRRANELRGLFERARRARTRPGRVYEKIARASLFADISSLLHSDSPQLEEAAAPHGKVVLLGSAPPDDRLHRAVEDAGWTVVEEIYDRSLRRLGKEVVPVSSEEPADSVARQWLSHTGGKRDFVDTGEQVAAILRGRSVDAAILWATREDEVLAWRVPAHRAALAELGVPSLVLTARSWYADDGALAEIEAFLRGLN